MLFFSKFDCVFAAAVVVLGSTPFANAESCVDKHEKIADCMEWAWHGECDKNPGFMHLQCRKSCGLCKPSKSETDNEDTCVNWHAKCDDWATKGNSQVDNLCKGNWNKWKNGKKLTGAYIVEMCPKACKVCDIHLDDRDIDLGIGLPQSFPGMEDDKELFNLLLGKVAETRAYVESIEDEEIREVCKMSHPNCARYALSSDCQTHFDHPIMKYGCAAACQTCEKLVEDNGIFEARYMWGDALREFNEKKLAKETIKATV
ncbi:unnamed protein product [Pseudo-nitzschia multistriata]|uniref:ShKT domain-containing protein n=1 Tax=Pseudo-nitzschia multistriata TaxID=183589 RepID=A0A448YWG7_9STRA|nr:unnamed protein product [Pseudo-nitzschia multistriata]